MWKHWTCYNILLVDRFCSFDIEWFFIVSLPNKIKIEVENSWNVRNCLIEMSVFFMEIQSLIFLNIPSNHHHHHQVAYCYCLQLCQGFLTLFLGILIFIHDPILWDYNFSGIWEWAGFDLILFIWLYYCNEPKNAIVLLC